MPDGEKFTHSHHAHLEPIKAKIYVLGRVADIINLPFLKIVQLVSELQNPENSTLQVGE